MIILLLLLLGGVLLAFGAFTSSPYKTPVSVVGLVLYVLGLVFLFAGPISVYSV